MEVGYGILAGLDSCQRRMLGELHISGKPPCAIAVWTLPKGCVDEYWEIGNIYCLAQSPSQGEYVSNKVKTNGRKSGRFFIFRNPNLQGKKC